MVLLHQCWCRMVMLKLQCMVMLHQCWCRMVMLKLQCMVMLHQCWCRMVMLKLQCMVMLHQCWCRMVMLKLQCMVMLHHGPYEVSMVVQLYSVAVIYFHGDVASMIMQHGDGESMVMQHCVIAVWVLIHYSLVAASVYVQGHWQIQRGGRGPDPLPPPPLKNHKNIGFQSNTGLHPQKNHKATKPAFNFGPSSAHQRNLNGVSLVGWLLPTYSGMRISLPSFTN